LNKKNLTFINLSYNNINKFSDLINYVDENENIIKLIYEGNSISSTQKDKLDSIIQNNFGIFKLFKK
jgi:hypothetical protein